nr:reverse transcriptase domain-containing protein [Tanacetum cinerariifolium]
MIVWIGWVRLPNICVVIRADGTPTLYLDALVYVWIWTPVWAIGVVRDLGFGCDLGHHSRFFEIGNQSQDNATKDKDHSTGRPAAESLGGGMGVRVGKGGRGRRPREGNDERVDDLNGQGNNQGMGANEGVEGVNRNVEGVDNQENVGNQNGNMVNENAQGNVRNVIVNGNRVGCSYKEFLACNPKEYDGKGGAVVFTRWIEKMENVQEMSGCSVDQKVKYTVGSFIGKALTWWNSQIRTLSQEVAVSMSWNEFKFMMIEEFCPSHEMKKLETELWNHAMVEAVHAAYTDRFHELARLVTHLVTPKSRKIERNGSIKKVEKRGNVGEPSKDKNGMDDNQRTRTGNAFAFAAILPCRTCFNCNLPGHLEKYCRGIPRNVNHVNARNPTIRACYKYGSTDHVRSACPRLNMAQGPKKNRSNQVIVNNRGQGRGNQGNKARGIEPNELGFRYEIEIASRQLVEIDKVIKICKLEIEGHVFDIDLIPFGHRSFDVIIVMDWLSNHRAEIICHEKVVRTPLLDGKVFLDDLSRLPPVLEIKFRFELFPEAMPVAKSPYRLAPSELEELSGQLKELQDKGSLRNFSKIAKSLTILTQKCKTFDWGEEQELAFQILRDKLCNTHVLVLSDGPKDVMIYCDALGIGLGYVLMQRERVEYATTSLDREANVVADPLSRKERVVPKRVRAMNMNLQSSIKDKILLAQKEVVDESTRLQKVNARGIRNSFRHDYGLSPSDRCYHSSVRCAPFEALYGRKCRSPIMWAEKSYADKRRKPLEFSVGDYVLLKVSPWKGMVCFGKKEKLAPRFVGPFEIVEKVGPVAYRLDLPKELNSVHDTFHVSNHKKCLADPTLQVP